MRDTTASSSAWVASSEESQAVKALMKTALDLTANIRLVADTLGQSDANHRHLSSSIEARTHRIDRFEKRGEDQFRNVTLWGTFGWYPFFRI